ncbi:MAG: asparagine synthase (glutamine-hydrolyzing), partial [Ferruginibacter sp.]
DFFHARLSIQDLTDAGAQPMQLRDRYTIVFNGEIYNHMELRSRFALHANTRSDTETILLLYEKLGPSFLNELDGMFAIAIYDAEKKQLFLARDRAGKKPMYIYQKNNALLFCSELNALQSQVPLEINQASFFHYLRLGVFYRQFTPYHNVSELRAGTYWLVDVNTLQVSESRWWNINHFYQQRSSDTLEEAIQKTDHLLHQAIRRRIDASDLDVGCFLSGGIDSGLITAIASAIKGRLKTFTVSVLGEYDEAPLAKLVANRYATEHTEITISFDRLKNDVEKIICQHGEPFFDSSNIPTYYVSQVTKQYVTVVLNGDGADELFGGYRRYVPFTTIDFFNTGSLVRGAAKIAGRILPPANKKKSFYFFLTRFFSFAARKDLEIYLSAGIDLIDDYEDQILANAQDYLQPLRHDFKQITESGISGLKKIMNLDFDTNLFSDLLVKMDIATMAHSLEGRSPFLCKELLEYAPTLDDRLKIRGSTTKYILRQLAKKYLPEPLIHQPKRGFEIPLKTWVNGALRDMISDYLLSRDAYHHQLLKPTFVQQVLENRIAIPAEKKAKILWMLFCLEVWYKKSHQLPGLN